MTPEPLDSGVYRELVRRALAEDLGWGDITTSAVIGGEARAVARIVAGEDLVLAGADVALEVFRQLDPGVSVVSQQSDGVCVGRGHVVAELQGLAQPLLTAERTALNVLRHLSGIATLTRRFVDATGGRLQIVDTRKTLPLLRALEKYAVRVGGGLNGRFSMDDGVILKRNHVRLAGGIADAVARAHAAHPDVPVQVEVVSVDDTAAALASGASVVLFSGTRLDDLTETVSRCRGRARVEVCGRWDVADLDAIARTGADFVSLGCLTDSAPAVDMHVELESC
jgi:nicotinate-nucleotide pyrophosphorylase (carboxylating)